VERDFRFCKKLKKKVDNFCFFYYNLIIQFFLTSKMGGFMAKVLVIEMFQEECQAQAASSFTNADGVKMDFEAKPARVINGALVEMVDDRRCRAAVELPMYQKEIKAGDVLTIECKNLQLFERVWAVRNISRYTPALQAKKLNQ
jgi:hypothetical protein